MKRKIALIMVACMVSASLTACGGEAKEAESSSSAPVSVVETTSIPTPTPTAEPEKTIDDVPDEYFENYEEAEFDKYNSYASENGLKDTPIWIEGTYEGTEQLEGDNYSLLYAVVTDSDGNQWAVDIDTIYFEDAAESDIYKSLNVFKGKHAVVFGVYEGFSDTLEKPIFKLCKIYDINSEKLLITEYGETSALSPECENFVPEKEVQTLASEQKDVPTVTVDQISDKYADSYVWIENCVIDCNGTTSCIAWVPSKDGYPEYFDITKNKYEDYEEIETPDCYDDLKNGDAVKLLVKVHKDGSYGYYGYFAESMEITGTVDLQSVYDSYKSLCKPLDYEAVLRNPKKEYKKLCVVKGTIFYVYDSSSYDQEFLLDTEDGYVCVRYRSTSEDRYIEGDNLSVYGYTDSALTDSYAQIDKVPLVWSKYIEFN